MDVYHSKIKWPFLHYNKSLNAFYKNYNYLISISDDSYNDVTRSIEEREADLRKKKPVYTAIINPVGTVFTEVLNVSPSVVKYKEVHKSRLRTLIHVVNKDIGRELPIDNLTGSSFVIKEFGDYFEISTGLQSRGESEFTYKVFNK